MASKPRPLDKFRLTDVYRPLDWRHVRAKELAGNGENPPLPLRYTDDDVVRRLRKYLINTRRYPEEQDLFLTDPELFNAFRVQRRRGDEFRWYLEARILSGQTDEEIGAKLALLPDAVSLYEQSFFHVRDRLGFHDWTLRQILGPRIDRSTAERAEEIAAKLFAYFGGPLALDVILTGMPQGRMLENPEHAADYMDEAWAATIRKRSFAAARAVSFDAYNVMQVFEIHGRLIDAVKSGAGGGAGGGGSGEVNQRIYDFCRTIPWKVGPAYGEEAKTIGASFQRETVDLRTDQLLHLTTSQDPTAFEHLKGRTMRPPRPKDDPVFEIQPSKPV